MRRILPLLLVACVLGVLAWAKAKFELDARVTAYTEAMRHEVLAPSQTTGLIPDEAMVRERASSVAMANGLEVLEISFTTAEMGAPGAGPAGAAAQAVANQLGEVQVQRYEGESFDGRPIVSTRSTRLRATVATLRVHVRGSKWLWSIDRTPEVSRTFDYHF